MADVPETTPVETADTTEEMPVEAEPNTPEEGDNKKIEEYFRTRVASAKKHNESFHTEWKGNVERRLGKVGQVYTGGLPGDSTDQSELNPDWSLTKIKTANLYSQVPEVQGTHENKQYEAAVPPFVKSLNFEIGAKRAHIGVAMEECLNDVVNASGIAAIYTGYEATFETQEVPLVDGLMQLLPKPILERLAAIGKIPTKSVTTTVDARFYQKRIPPTDLLTPAEFVGSDFNDGDFIGQRGKMPWAVAVREFHLTEDDKENVLGGDDSRKREDLRSEPEKANVEGLKNITYDEIFYWRNRVDPEEKYFKAIWRLVWVHGKDEPVIHEEYKGQQFSQQARGFVGVTRFPIQVLTLTYISDNPIPPSDTAAGKPQVNDLRRSRAQMFQNRERSTPLRWVDVTRVDPIVLESFLRGTYQGVIPTNGSGERTFGEIARAQYPAEDQAFDSAAKQDLIELWQVAPQMQMGGGGNGRQNKAQSEQAGAVYATRLGLERNRVAAFFLANCEVLAGLMALYSDFPILTKQEKDAMLQVWDDKKILHDLVFKIRPDSTIVLDSGQRADRLFKFLNMTVKSGYVAPKSILVELAELAGLDPAEVIHDPQPPKPDAPNISFRFSGKEDIMNVGVMSLLVALKKAPLPQDLEAAKAILAAVVQPPAPPKPPPAPGAPGSGQPGPVLPPTGPGQPGTGQAPAPGTPEAHPNWSLGGRIAKRNRDANGG